MNMTFGQTTGGRVESSGRRRPGGQGQGLGLARIRADLPYFRVRRPAPMTNRLR